MKYFILICIFFAVNNSLIAQQLSIKGRVTNSLTHVPVPGASVTLLDSRENTSTDAKGVFAITANPSDSIIISCIGYISFKLPVSAEMEVSLQPDVKSLDEVLISASREERSRKEIPLAVSKINRSTIEETHAVALYQLLNKVSGVYMVNLGNEQHTMAIRQPITYNAFYLYLEDGLPVRPTGIFNHNALYEINMNGLKDIEVIKGPASSLYGSNSIGGAVNFISPVPSSTQDKHFSLQADGYHYYRADASAGFTSGKLGVYIGGYAARQVKSWQDYTDFDKYSGTLKATYQFNAATRLTVMGTLSSLNTQTPGSIDSAKFYNRRYESNQRFTYRKVNAFRASSRMDHTWNERNVTFFSAFFRNNSTGQLPSYFIQDIRNSSGQYLRSAGQENNQSFNSYGFLLQHRVNFSFLNSQLVAGAYLDNSPSSYYANFLDITKDVAKNYYTGYTSKDSLIDDYKINLFNTAAYLQYEMHPAEPLRIVAGFRYDNVIYNFKNGLPPSRTKYKQQEKNKFNILAPKIGATFDLGKGIGLYSNFSIGFQPPETSTLYGSRQSVPLEQAVFYNYEVGGWLPLADRKIHIEFSVYDMEGKNEIISVLMPDNTTQNQNAGATRHIGVEYSVAYLPSPQWHIRFNGTTASHTYVTYSEINFNKTVSYDGKRMVNAPSWIANSELTWKPGFFKGFRSSVEWQHIGKYFVNSANTKTYNGYDIFSLRLGYDPKNKGSKGIGIWFNALNMTNKLYATTVTGNQYGVTYNAAPPRTFSLGLSYTLLK